MDLSWPLAAVIVAALAAACVALRVSLPYLVGHSTAQAREKALEEVNKRLANVEGEVFAPKRAMPGRLR